MNHTLLPATPGARLRPTRRTTSLDRPPSVLSRVMVALLTFLMLLPIVWATLSAFKPPASIINAPLTFDLSSFSTGNFTAMFRDVPIGTGFMNTGIVLLVKGGLTMVFAPLAGYAFAKYQFRGKNVIFSAVLITLMLPVIVLMIPLLLQMKELGWVNTYQGLILPGSIDAFAIFWMRQTIAAVPDELLDAARVDGCGELGIFARIVLPVIRPGLAGLAVLTTMNIYNDFVWPVIVTSSERMQTLQVVLSTLAQNISGKNIGTDFATVWGELLAASTIATIPLLVIFMVLQRHFVNGILAGSVKG